ncbi:uncharacterized protein T551_03018 [Pneumocystis jirovecii RU7]|uniref:ORC6 first cyclin-like domain-containing protein n=1 Tax=Pneumocystis jirovecii (strain RU7) TaxID=1408657 RepID=A0A0W4ZGK8_PNEJ7|nr:uncharacterized protein T551_03018 [Pneumocystis jirovecii RU7]KTW27519.1 hypothetical protein T551_03018 [Pneumocystis jirovecii RU7]
MFNLEEIVYQILPTLEQPYPSVLLNTIDQLVQWSYQKEMILKPKEEPARLRLCAHVAYERLSKKLSLPALSMEKLPLPIKKYEILLDRFRHELPERLKRKASCEFDGDDKGLSLCIEMIYELCNKMKIQLQTKYFVNALKACYSRYSEVHQKKKLAAVVFILVLQRLRGEHMINREEKEQVLSLFGIRDMKQAELKRWNDLIKQDSIEYGWMDAIFQEKNGQLIEVEPATEAESQSQAISGVGMMIYPQVDFYGDKHYSEYLKWKEDILAKVLLKKSKS